MKNRVYESMTRVVMGQFTVRVWCIEKEISYEGTFIDYELLKFGPRQEIMDAIAGLYTAQDISEALDKFPRVSAYEILDRNGNGAIVYPDWK